MDVLSTLVVEQIQNDCTTFMEETIVSAKVSFSWTNSAKLSSSFPHKSKNRCSRTQSQGQNVKRNLPRYYYLKQKTPIKSPFKYSQLCV